MRPYTATEAVETARPRFWDESWDPHTVYLAILPALQAAARAHGYALAVHGSTRRDFDLIAVPWVEEYSNPDILAAALQTAACGLVSTIVGSWEGRGSSTAAQAWTRKPNGRFAIVLPIGMQHFLDLSIVGAQ